MFYHGHNGSPRQYRRGRLGSVWSALLSTTQHVAYLLHLPLDPLVSGTISHLSPIFLPSSCTRSLKTARMSSSQSDLCEERCQALINYLRGSKAGKPQYPAGFTKNRKRGLRQQATSFKEKDGVLYHKQAGPTGGIINMQRVVSSKQEQTRLIRACHVSTDANYHYGHDKHLAR